MFGSNKANTGFTLLELLVVLFLVAMITGMAMLSLPNTRRSEVRSHHEQLLGLISHLQQQAVMSSTPLALTLQGAEPKLWRYDGGRDWVEFPLPPFASRKEQLFKTQIRPKANLGSVSPDLVAPVVFLPGGEYTPFTGTTSAFDNEQVLVRFKGDGASPIVSFYVQP